MIRHALRGRSPKTLAAMLVTLFSAALLLSIEAVTINAGEEAAADAQQAENIRGYDQATLPAGEGGIDLEMVGVRATATPTRTPTPVNIGNLVWDDFDGDGRQDAGEPGLNNITVQLWNSAKTVKIDQDKTNASGIYTLTAPTPGNYRIRVVLPGGGDVFSPKNQASGDDQLDSDINPTGTSAGYTDIFNLASNVISTTIMDAGIIKFRTPTPTRTPTPINIGNFVWHDADSDGVQDGGEVGVPYVTVELWNSTKTTMLDSDVTTASGLYSLTAPTPGNYALRVVKPGSSSFTNKNVGDDQLDSDFNADGFTDVFNLASNLISITTIDAGLENVPVTTSSVDTIAVYGKSQRKFSLVDVQTDKPPNIAYTAYASNAPEKGLFVMGDWNADGQKTPALFGSDGLFWYTNTIHPSALWSSVNMGLTNGKFAAVAGRFSAVIPNDCFGVVRLDAGTAPAYPLYYFCLGGAGALQQQTLTVSIPGPGKYQFTAGDFNGDGLDSVAARRGKRFKWSNTAPSQGAAALTNEQNFGDPYQGYGIAVAGDWDGNGVSTFGLYFEDTPRFYWRNDLGAAKAALSRQRLKNKTGSNHLAASWRETVEVRGAEQVQVQGGALPIPGTPAGIGTAGATGTFTPTFTPTPSYMPAVTDAPTVFDLPTSTPLPTLPPTETPLPTFVPTATDVPAEVTE